MLRQHKSSGQKNQKQKVSFNTSKPLDSGFYPSANSRHFLSRLSTTFLLDHLKNGGAMRDRTADLLRAKQALSQLSYSPNSRKLVGLAGLEPATSPLSGVRSNHLSYRPNSSLAAIASRSRQQACLKQLIKNYICECLSATSCFKEVIQPQVPLGLPCYDFTPVINPTVDAPLRS